jgi:hypothetical protein
MQKGTYYSRKLLYAVRPLLSPISIWTIRIIFTLSSNYQSKTRTFILIMSFLGKILLICLVLVERCNRYPIIIL